MDSPTSSSFIHRYYVLVKAHYFLYFSAFGILYPILNITLRSRGLATNELSYINTIIPFLVFFTNPIIGFIADHLHRRLLIFNIVLTIVTISYGIIFLLPSIKSRNIQANLVYDYDVGRVLDFCASQEVATKCASRAECGCTYQANCTLNDLMNQYNHNRFQTFSFDFSMSSKDSSKNTTEPKSCGIEYRIPVEQDIKYHTQNQSLYLHPYNTTSFHLAICEITCSIAHFCHGTRYPHQIHYIIFYSLLFIVGTNFLTNGIALGVSIGFAAIDNPGSFGIQRVWGTVGFGISAFGVSRLYELLKTEYLYIILFIFTAVLCIIITSFIRLQPIKPVEKELDEITEVKKKNKSRTGLSAFFPLLKQLDVIILLTLALLWGMSYAVLDPYLYLYIDEIAPCQSHSIVGWMSGVSATAEVLAFFFAGRVMKLLGTNLASVLILLAFAIRFGGYYLITKPILLTLMEPMHFFNFGILYVFIAQETDKIAPEGLSGTLQSVALGLTFGLGRGIGLLISSFIYTLIEQRVLFLIFSIFNLILVAIFSIYFIIKKQRSKKTSKETNPTSSKVVIDSDVNLNEEPLLNPTIRQIANQ